MLFRIVWILHGNCIHFLCVFNLKEMRGSAGEKLLFILSTFFLKLSKE